MTRVMVFAPAPILTVTIERRGDASDLHLHAGGQGVWQARMLAALGMDVALCTNVGGETGRVLRTLLKNEPVRLKVISGESTNGFYIHDRRNGNRKVVAEHAGKTLSRHELDTLYNMALVEGLESAACLLSGPPDAKAVPADVYRRLASDLSAQNNLVGADLTNEFLTAALAGGVDVVKVSHEDVSSKDELAEARKLHQAGGKVVIISRAEHPALAFTVDQHDREIYYEVVMPKLAAADSRGAGDSMMAGVLAALAAGKNLEYALRLGAAAGALNVTRHGLGTGKRADITRLTKKVELREISSERSAAIRMSPDELARWSQP